MQTFYRVYPYPIFILLSIKTRIETFSDDDTPKPMYLIFILLSIKTRIETMKTENLYRFSIHFYPTIH